MKVSYNDSPLSIGQLVFSKRGRDAGRLFVIIAAAGEYIYLADGSLRPVSRPKKKKLMHVQRTNCISQEIQSKILNMAIDDSDNGGDGGKKGQPLLDADVRRVLSAYARADVNNDGGRP